jgi:Protein of unknown function (DUF2530)
VAGNITGTGEHRAGRAPRNLALVASPRRSPPPPLEGNAGLITAVITTGWAIALIVVLIIRDSLPPAERWWVWTCTTGLVLGLFGLWYVPHLQRRRATAAGRRGARSANPEPGQPPPLNDSNTVSSSETPGRSTRS